MKKTIGTLMVAVSVLAVSAAANASEYRPYVGLDYVNSKVNTEGSIYKPHFDNLSFNVGSTITDYFSTEVFYQMSNTDKRNYIDHGLKTSFDAVGLDLIGYMPLDCNQDINLIGALGIGEYEFTTKEKPESKSADDGGLGYRFALGAEYNFDDNWGVRGLVRHVEFDKLDHLDHMMEYVVGARYTF